MTWIKKGLIYNVDERAPFATNSVLTPNPFLLMEAKEYLERSMGRSVDIIRNHSNLNPRLRKRIERDGITVF